MRHFLRYAAVGAVGFGVDAASFFTLVHGVGLPWEAARALAFLIAVGVTWGANRRFTFSSQSPAAAEGFRYLAVQSAGCCINYLAFSIAIAAVTVDRWLLTPYIAGTASALAFNWLLARHYVFRGA